MKSILALCILAIVASASDRASAQANVNENQSTTLYVDANTGNDGNSGAQSSPLKTISAAIAKANHFNQQNVGVKVILNAGVYRESVTIGNYKTTGAPLTLQAAVAGTAVISGSDVLHGWYYGDGVYTKGWTYPISSCAVPSGWPKTFAPIGLRTEMIFVNGVPLTQVTAWADLRPGTFFLNTTYSVLHINPPTGTDMSTAVVEAAVRPTTFSLVNRTNVVLRGLVFEHAANCMNSTGANIYSSNNVLIDSVQARWNNWGGLGIYSSNGVTLQNSVASNNGGVGFHASRTQNLLLDFNESDYNNWRGAQAAFYDWGMGGTKLMYERNVTVQNHFSYNNQAQGLWFDTDNENVTIRNATLSGNVQAAVQLEKNQGPLTLENSLLCSSGAGVNILNTAALTIQNNTFYSNSGTNKAQAEIYVGGQPGGRIIIDWLTGQAHELFTTGMQLSGNTFENAETGQFTFGSYLGGTDWTLFTSTLKSSNNIWYDPHTPSPFKLPNGHLVSLSGFQSTVQADYSSLWQIPATSAAAACKAPAPDYADFNINLDNNNYTMAAGKAVATVRVNSFGYGPVTLKAEGMPKGVGATLSQASLTSGVVTLTLTATKNAAVQTVPITLFGVSGSRVHSATFYLQVNPL